MSVPAKRQIASDLAKEFGLKSCSVCLRYFYTEVMYRMHLSNMHGAKSLLPSPTTPPAPGQGSSPKVESQNLSQISLTMSSLQHSINSKQSAWNSSPGKTASPRRNASNNNQVDKIENDSVTGSGKQKNKLDCPQCSRTFSSKQSVTRHVVKFHTNKKDFQCKFCPEKFFFNNELKKHFKKKHSDETILLEAGLVLNKNVHELMESSSDQTIPKQTPIQPSHTKQNKEEENEINLNKQDQADLQVSPVQTTETDIEPSSTKPADENDNKFSSNEKDPEDMDSISAQTIITEIQPSLSNHDVQNEEVTKINSGKQDQEEMEASRDQAIETDIQPSHTKQDGEKDIEMNSVNQGDMALILDQTIETDIQPSHTKQDDAKENDMNLDNQDQGEMGLSPDQTIKTDIQPSHTKQDDEKENEMTLKKQDHEDMQPIPDQITQTEINVQNEQLDQTRSADKKDQDEINSEKCEDIMEVSPIQSVEIVNPDETKLADEKDQRMEITKDDMGEEGTFETEKKPMLTDSDNKDQ